MIKYDLCIYINLYIYIYICMCIYIYTSKYQNIHSSHSSTVFPMKDPVPKEPVTMIDLRAQQQRLDRPLRRWIQGITSEMKTFQHEKTRDFWWFAMGFMGIRHEKWWIDHEKWWFTVNDDDLLWDLCGCTQDLVGFIMDSWLPWIHGGFMMIYGDLDGFIVSW